MKLKCGVDEAGRHAKKEPVLTNTVFLPNSNTTGSVHAPHSRDTSKSKFNKNNNKHEKKIYNKFLLLVNIYFFSLITTICCESYTLRFAPVVVGGMDLLCLLRVA